MKKIFISYCWAQEDWVENYLLPILDASEHHTPRIDRRHFRAGKSLPEQIKGEQDQADMQLLCFSKDYLGSGACMKEMHYAMQEESKHHRGNVIPLVLEKIELPYAVTTPELLYIRLEKDKIGDKASWQKLSEALEIDLGVDCHAWLTAMREIIRKLERGSVNLVAQKGWQSLISYLESYYNRKALDFHSPQTHTRLRLVKQILKNMGSSIPCQGNEEEALGILDDALNSQERPHLEIWTHFQDAITRGMNGNQVYSQDFFTSLRYYMTTLQKLQILIVSREPFGNWLQRTIDSEIPLPMVRL